MDFGEKKDTVSFPTPVDSTRKESEPDPVDQLKCSSEDLTSRASKIQLSDLVTPRDEPRIAIGEVAKFSEGGENFTLM